jgi:hypothetical protein
MSVAVGRIDRERLPAGLVAVLDDSSALDNAIGELFTYATGNRQCNRPRRGIVFRVVREKERDSIVHGIWNSRDKKEASVYSAAFRIAVGHMHIMDDSFVSHSCNRHGESEHDPRRLSMSLPDFKRIPKVVDPRNIVDFVLGKGLPRIVYEQVCGEHTLVVVEELQANVGLAIKTAYKKK